MNGTTSSVGQSVNVYEWSQGSNQTPATSTDADGTGPGTTGIFDAVLDIRGYTTGVVDEAIVYAYNADTDDAEGSTLRSQTITNIAVTPTSQNRANPDNAEITVTVTDQFGQPVAGAQIGAGADIDTDGVGPDTDTDGAETVIGYTNGLGQFFDDTTTGAGDKKYYVNTTDNDAYQFGVDPTATASVNGFTPVLTSVDIVNERNRANFDLDEFSSNGTDAGADGDDFTIEVKDQFGNLVDAGGDVEYRFVIDPTGPGNTVTTPYINAGASVSDGVYEVYGPTDQQFGSDIPASTVTVQARATSGVVGSTAVPAAAEVVNVGESEVTFDEGTNANPAQNGTFTVTGNLALVDDSAPLAGRAVYLDYSRGDATYNSQISPQAQQPAGTTVTGFNQAVAITDANGNFSVVINDPAFPATEEVNNDLYAYAEESRTDGTSLFGNNGAQDFTDGDADAERQLTINFVATPAVDAIEFDTEVLDPRGFPNVAGPGVPVDFDIELLGADPTPANGIDDRPSLQDVPVTVTIDTGFLSPNAENPDDLNLANDHDSVGDLWGYFQNDGASKTVSTGDNAEAGVVAAIERNEGFDDNGLVNATVTITAGGKTVTENITWDVRALLNAANPEFTRADGEPTNPVAVSQDVDFDLTVEDQFGNLAGDTQARISDDSTVADFRTDEDFDGTLTDFTTSGPGVTAFSDAPANQTLTATMQPGEVVVAANEDSNPNNKTITVDADPIVWVADDTTPPPSTGRVAIEAKLFGKNFNAKFDRLVVNAPKIAQGAAVRLFKVVNGNKRIQVGNVKGLNAKGDAVFTVADRNGRNITRYVAVIAGPPRR